MLSDLSICLVQTELFWEDMAANLKHFDGLLQSISKPVDLIVLPEMFTTGFSMKPFEFANEESNAACIQQMKIWAKRHKAVVCGSMMYASNNSFFNRFLWVSPDESFHFYDKAHLFRMGEENNHYQKGNQQLLVELKGWKLACFVCYDLRFPVWMRRTPNYDYDAIVLVANWPAVRNMQWQLLTRARAIENQSYVIAVNRLGMDANQINHIGNSAVIEPTGDCLLDAASAPGLFFGTLSVNALQQYRQRFPVALDADVFEWKIS
jgi:omega-amidase